MSSINQQEFNKLASGMDDIHNSEIRLPFGKFKGQELKDVPSGYLEWLFLEKWPKPSLKNAIQRELKNR